MRIAIPEELNTVPINDEEEQNRRVHVKELQYTRILFIQSLMYIFAFLLTWCFVIASVVMDHPYATMEVAKVVLFPMQGCWNLIIFVFDKVFLVRCTDGNEHLWDALKCVFLHPEDTPRIVLTNIDIVVGGVEQSQDDFFRFGNIRINLNEEEKSQSKPNDDVSSAGAMRSYSGT